MPKYRIEFECEEHELDTVLGNMAVNGFMGFLKEVEETTFYEKLTRLRNSCQQGLDGTWDCSTDEGREGFEPMIDSCEEIAEMLGIELPEYDNDNSDDDE